MSHALGFHRPLIAAVHKGQAPVLVADSIALAASQYAMNAGAANNIEMVRTACLTTEKAKARTPAAGTLAAIILSAMDAIKAGAEKAGARSKGKDEKRSPSERQAVADAYGQEQRAAFVAAVDAAAAARKEKADKRAAEKDAAAPAAGASAGTDEGATTKAPTRTAAVNPAELPAAIALQALATLSDAELMALAGGEHAELARRVAACLTLPLAVSGAAAAAVTKKAQRAARKGSPVAPAVDASEAGALGAMAHALVTAGAAHADAVHAA